MSRLDAERRALSAAQRAARVAHKKALRTRKSADHGAHKRARAAVNRTHVRLTKLRNQARVAKERLESVHAEERLKARIASIKATLDSHNSKGMVQIEDKLAATLTRLAKSKRARLIKEEISRANKRARVAAAKIKAAERAHGVAQRAKQRRAAQKTTARPKTPKS